MRAESLDVSLNLGRLRLWALGSDAGREGLEGDCVDAVIEPILVDRAQSGG